MSMTDHARQVDLEWKRQCVFWLKIAGLIGIVALFLINHFEISDNYFWIGPVLAIAAQIADRWVERIPESPPGDASAIQPEHT
jgi:hypothetical protein